jgi:hypothetical protein
LRHGSQRVVFRTVEDHGGVVSGYLATYLLPFLGNLPTTPGDFTAYVIYFVTAFVVYVRTDLALINPTLYILGYRVFRFEIGDLPGDEPADCSPMSGYSGSTERHIEAYSRCPVEM